MKKKKKQVTINIKHIIIFMIIVIGLITMCVVVFRNKNDESSTQRIEKQQSSQTIKNDNNEDVDMNLREQISSFNSKFELFEGGREGEMVVTYLDQIIASNKENGNHLVGILFNGKSTTDESEINEIKESINDSKMYEIVLEYDEEGYVNLVKIID